MPGLAPSRALMGVQRFAAARSAASAAAAPTILEQAFVIVTACAFGVDLFRMLGDPEGGGARIAYVPFYIAICAAIGLHWSVSLSNWRRLLPVALLILLPLCTVLWSVDPRATTVRGLQLLGSSFFGIYLAARFGLARSVRLLAVAYCIIGTLSVAAVFVWPHFATTDGIRSAWRGLYVHKNGLGAAAGAGLLLCWYTLGTTRGKARLLLVAGIAMLALLLLGSRSATSMLAVVAAGAAVLVGRIGSRFSRYAVAALFTVAAAVVIALAMAGITPADWLQAIGRDSSLTGRLPIWDLSWDAILRRPWLGYGFDAFWANGSSELARISEFLNYSPYYSHSGALELLLNGGAIIALFVVAQVGITVGKAARWMSTAPGADASLPFAFAAYFVVMNISESKIWAPNDLVWAVWIMFATILATNSARLRSATRQHASREETQARAESPQA